MVYRDLEVYSFQGQISVKKAYLRESKVSLIYMLRCPYFREVF